MIIIHYALRKKDPNYMVVVAWSGALPIQDERLLGRSISARVLGLFSSERFANEMSAVTLVMVILQESKKTGIIAM